jgi:hypothetical protein
MQPQPGGRRRIDQVLAGDFLDGLQDLPVEELRARRTEAEQEETDLSYARRLLHGRLDLLRAEQAARTGGADAPGDGVQSTEELVASLARTLADPPGPSHGMGKHGLVEPSRVGEHRRAAEAAVADPATSNPAGMSDEDLAAAVERFDGLQREVGEQRAAVQKAADALSEELGRRYREGLLNVDDVLGAERG